MNNWRYFTLDELCRSSAALRAEIRNIPNDELLKNLNRLVKELLDPLRAEWGAPIIVTSGFRCNELNSLVGGAKCSYHTLGLVADLVAPATGLRSAQQNTMHLYKLIKKNMDRFFVDEVIAEKAKQGRTCEWIHVQIFKPNTLPRHLAFECQIFLT